MATNEAPDADILRDWRSCGDWDIRILRVVHAGKWKVLVFVHRPPREELQLTSEPLDLNSEAEAMEGALAAARAFIDAQPK